MKVFVMLSLFVAALAYTDLDDTVSFDKIIANNTELVKDIDCAIGLQPCSPVLQKYKDHTPEAVSDACNECTDIEKHDLVAIIKAMRKLPEKFKMYQSMYDPDGTRIPAIEEKLKGYLKKP